MDKDPEPENRDMEVTEFENLISADNRTYVAIRTLPNSGGVFGYIAITMGDGDEPKWLDCNGKPICTPVPFNLRVEQVKTDIQLKCLAYDETDAKQVWSVLNNRKSICLRNEFYDFYKTLYENVQQEMVAEANTCVVRKCSHPFINKLLEFLVVSNNSDLKYDSKTNNHLMFINVPK